MDLAVMQIISLNVILSTTVLPEQKCIYIITFCSKMHKEVYDSDASSNNPLRGITVRNKMVQLY